MQFHFRKKRVYLFEARLLGLTLSKKYSHDICVGTDLVPDTPMHPVMYNIANANLGNMTLGGRQWMRRLLSHTRQQNIPELRSLIGTSVSPVVPPFIDDRWFKKNNHIIIGDDRVRWRGPQPSKRACKTLELLRGCNAAHRSFLTVVTTPALSREQALVAAAKDGKKLAAHIRRRFPKAIFILVPEVDILLARNVSASLFADARWKNGLGDHQIIYKVHFHAIIYVPSMTTPEVQKAFYVTPTGKRSRRYAGANQVRALEISEEDTDSAKGSDIYKCFGYAIKGHFKPPVMDAMAECFAEWLLLTDKITSNQKLIVTGGSYRGIFRYCADCKSHHRPDDSCKCKSVISGSDDDFGSSLDDVDNGSFGDCSAVSLNSDIGISSLSSGSNDSSIYLNCPTPSHCAEIQKSTMKKETGLITAVVEFGQRLWQTSHPAMAP